MEMEQPPLQNNVWKAPLKNPKDFGKKGSSNEIDLKMGKLTKEDVTCPICLSIMIEPTTLPCKHSLCLACYTTHIDVTSLQCPCCRRRLSIWSRRTTKKQELLDSTLWERIKQEFPTYVEARLNGEDSQDMFATDTTCLQGHGLGESSSGMIRDGQICDDKPGELWMELQSIMDQHNQDLEKKRLLDEAASESLIKSLLQENQEPLCRDRSQEEQDYLMALQLNEEINTEPVLPLRRSTRSSSGRERGNLIEGDTENPPIRNQNHEHLKSNLVRPPRKARAATSIAECSCSLHERNRNPFQKTPTSKSPVACDLSLQRKRKSSLNASNQFDKNRCELSISATELVDLESQDENENMSATQTQLPTTKSSSTSLCLSSSEISVIEENDNLEDMETEVSSIPGEECSPADLDIECNLYIPPEYCDYILTKEYYNELEIEADIVKTRLIIARQSAEDFALAKKISRNLEWYGEDMSPTSTNRARTYSLRKIHGAAEPNSDGSNVDMEVVVQTPFKKANETKDVDKSQDMIGDPNNIMYGTTSVPNVVSTTGFGSVPESPTCYPYKSSDCFTKEVDEKEKCQNMPENIFGEVAELLEDLITIVVALDE